MWNRIWDPERIRSGMETFGSGINSPDPQHCFDEDPDLPKKSQIRIRIIKLNSRIRIHIKVKSRTCKNDLKK
jgi:hypothetical protein